MLINNWPRKHDGPVSDWPRQRDRPVSDWPRQRDRPVSDWPRQRDRPVSDCCFYASFIDRLIIVVCGMFPGVERPSHHRLLII